MANASAALTLAPKTPRSDPPEQYSEVLSSEPSTTDTVADNVQGTDTIQSAIGSDSEAVIEESSVISDTALLASQGLTGFE